MYYLILKILQRKTKQCSTEMNFNCLVNIPTLSLSMHKKNKHTSQKCSHKKWNVHHKQHTSCNDDFRMEHTKRFAIYETTV